MITAIDMGPARKEHVFVINIQKVHIWAAICDFQQCGILASVDSNEPM